VLEPIFEADFEPVSYGFWPKRRAQDAMAEIHHYGTQGRVKDKRVLALVKTFVKAGVLTEGGDREDTHTGTPQGGSATRGRTVVSGCTKGGSMLSMV
jgi:RNA-directed DNA polymerase